MIQKGRKSECYSFEFRKMNWATVANMKGYQKAFGTSKEVPEGRENERLTK